MSNRKKSAETVCCLVILGFAVAHQASAESEAPESDTVVGAPNTEADLGELDPETQRYQAEVRQLDVRKNIWQSWVYAFKISPPEIRAKLWDELEQVKQQPDSDLPAIIADIEAEKAERAARASDYDEETLRYKAALQDAGYSQVEVDGLVEAILRSRSMDWLRFSLPPYQSSGRLTGMQ